MHSISLNGARPVSVLPGVNSAALSSGTGFTASAAAGLSAARGVSSTVLSPLGSQAVSVLLQTQDLSQTQPAGGHGGGGHRHGVTQAAQELEGQVAEQSEEAQAASRRKKLAKAAEANAASKANEAEGDDTPTDDADQQEGGAEDKRKPV